MRPQHPIFDIFIGRDGSAFRLYSAARSWTPPLVCDRMDDRGDVFPVAKPDLDDLADFMWSTDSPYEVRPTTDGGAEILAKGRSAICLLTWLEAIVAPAPAPARRTRGAACVGGRTRMPSMRPSHAPSFSSARIAALRAKLARKSLFTRIAPRTRLEWFIYALGALVIAVCIAALRYIFVAG